MKKFLAIALVMMLAVCAFAGCGGGDEATTEDVSYAGQGTAVEGNVIKIGVFEPTTGENGGGGIIDDNPSRRHRLRFVRQCDVSPRLESIDRNGCVQSRFCSALRHVPPDQTRRDVSRSFPQKT